MHQETITPSRWPEQIIHEELGKELLTFLAPKGTIVY